MYSQEAIAWCGFSACGILCLNFLKDYVAHSSLSTVSVQLWYFIFWKDVTLVQEALFRMFRSTFRERALADISRMITLVAIFQAFWHSLTVRFYMPFVSTIIAYKSIVGNGKGKCQHLNNKN